MTFFLASKRLPTVDFTALCVCFVAPHYHLVDVRPHTWPAGGLNLKGMMPFAFVTLSDQMFALQSLFVRSDAMSHDLELSEEDADGINIIVFAPCLFYGPIVYGPKR